MLKRLASIVLSLSIIVSAVFIAIIPTSAENSFVAQHMEVDFSKYELKNSAEHKNANNVFSSSTPTPYWEINSDGSNKYISMKKTNSMTKNFIGYYSFVLNPEGVAGDSTAKDSPLSKTDKIYSLEDGFRYRITFKYRLKSISPNRYIRVKVGAVGKGHLGSDESTLTYKLTDNDGDYLKLDVGDDWQEAAIEFTATKKESWKNMVDSLVVSFLPYSSNKDELMPYSAEYDLDLDDFIVDKLVSVNITDENGTTNTRYGIPSCESEYRTGFGTCSAEPILANNEGKSNYPTEFTADANAAELYTDKNFTNKADNAVFSAEGKTYYKKEIYNISKKDQASFCGFDEWNLRREFDIAGESTKLPYTSSFVKYGKLNDAWSISDNQAFTGTKSLYIDTVSDAGNSGNKYVYIGNGYELIPGHSYDISMWVKRDTSKSQTDDLSIGFANAGDLYSPYYLAGAKIKTGEFKGEWQQIIISATVPNEKPSNWNAKWTKDYAYYMAPVLGVYSKNAFWLDTVVISEKLSGGVWNGTEASSFALGNGTADDPYQISTAEELALLCKTVRDSKWNNYTTKGKYYVLTSDIVLNDTASANWKNTAREWYSTDAAAPAFKGVFDGKGHTISGLYINNTNNKSKGGLFVQIGRGAVVKNVGIENSYIKTTLSSGSVVGAILNENESDDSSAIPRIVACYAGENVTIDGGKESAGGILGRSDRFAELRYCYFLGTVLSEDATRAGGIVGSVFGGSDSSGNINFRSCYSAAKGDSGIVGRKSSATTGTNLYATTNKLGGTSVWTSVVPLTIDKMTGNAATQYMTTLDFAQVWKTLDNSTPILRIFESGYSGSDPDSVKDAFEEDYYDDANPGDVWSGKLASKYHGGKGTAEDPYQIATAEELAKLCFSVKNSSWGNYNKSTKGKYYVLTNDIVLNDTDAKAWMDSAKQWYSSSEGTPAFKGVFDGKGHTVSGIYINDTNDKSKGGLFIQIGRGAVVKNVGIENSYIKTTYCSGGITGAILNENESDDSSAIPRIVACYAGENVTIDGGKESAGGILGRSDRFAELRYCYFLGTVLSEDATRAGGLVGTIFSGSDQSGNIKFRSCYSAPKNSANIVGRKTTGTMVNNTYATANKNASGTVILSGVKLLAVERMTGSEAYEFMKTLDYNQIWRVIDGKTPKLRVFEPGYTGIDPDEANDAFERQIYDGAKPGDIWIGKISSDFASGSGTKEDPYIIETAEQLALLANKVANSYWNNYATEDKYYKLNSDIYLNDVSSKSWYENTGLNQWILGNSNDRAFCGHLDGNGYVIYGLYISDTDTSSCGLFVSAGKKSVIENLGIASSYILTEGRFVGAFYGSIEARNYGTESPIIRKCFVAEDVYLDSDYCVGGFMGGVPSTFKIEDSYFLGHVGGNSNSERTGGVIGSSWYLGEYTYENSDEVIKSYLTRIFVCNEDKNTITSKRTSLVNIVCENNYALKAQDGVSMAMGFSNMTGEKAKEHLSGFDFENTWQSVEKCTPIFKIFTLRHNDISAFVRLKGPVTVSFETYGGSELEPIIGESGSKIQLPTPTRNKDVFDGWYVYPLQTWDVPFNYDFFPDDDITLYAKWIETGITQDFENYPYKIPDEDGMEEGYELLKPGSADYTGEYLYDGIYALHRFGDIPGYKNACLFNPDSKGLTVGNEYEITMYVYIKGTPSNDDKLMLAYTQYADWAFDEDATEEICSLKSITPGSWQKVTYKFVAYGKYLAIRTPGVDMFIDGVYVLETGAKNLKSKAVKSQQKTITTVVSVNENNSGDKTSNSTNNGTEAKKYIKRIIRRKNVSNSNYTVFIVIGSISLVVIGAVTAFLIIRKKRIIHKSN